MNALQDNRTKERALPRVWRRFAFLRPGEAFDFRGRTFHARNFSAAWLLGFPIAQLWLDMERRVWIFPWTRVRTHTLVREANKSGFETVRRDINLRLKDSGQTHWVGDGCIPPHPPINNDDGRTGTSS